MNGERNCDEKGDVSCLGAESDCEQSSVNENCRWIWYSNQDCTEYGEAKTAQVHPQEDEYQYCWNGRVVEIKLDSFFFYFLLKWIPIDLDFEPTSNIESDSFICLFRLYFVVVEHRVCQIANEYILLFWPIVRVQVADVSILERSSKEELWSYVCNNEIVFRDSCIKVLLISFVIEPLVWASIFIRTQ